MNKLMKIIETPFIHIPAAFGVALRNSVTTVIKALATFATGKSSMDFPCRFLFSSMHNIAFTSIAAIVISMLHQCMGRIAVSPAGSV
ncbi:hypothetical protein ACLB1T_24040 [Escherichia coli]